MLPAASESNPPMFTYTPLPDTDTKGQRAPPHIRLIRVHDCDPDDPAIRISILVTSVEKAPIYQAVSYTWGDESNQENIYVRYASSLARKALGLARQALGLAAGRYGLMAVRKNCADVLRQVRHFKTSKYYWIDAICIDQQNIPEKNVQVARMGAIFEQAECVLACIGMHDQSSRLVASMFESFHSHLSRANVSLDDLADQENLILHPGHWLRQAKQDRDQMANRSACEESCCEWVDGIDDGALLEFFEAMQQLAQRPYFWRIWTLQELWVTREIQFFCGFDRLPVQTLLLWWGDWKHVGIHWPDIRSLWSVISSKIDFETKFPALSLGPGEDYSIILSKRWESSVSKRQQLDPYELMHIWCGRKCQDPRDIVYGTLTMANWNSINVKMPDGSRCAHEDPASFLPDYNLSTFELAKILVPRFGWFWYMHMCDYLQIDQTNEEIQQGMALRSKPWSQLPVSAPMDRLHWSKNPRRLARFDARGFRFGPNASCQVEDISAKSGPYTRIIVTSGYGGEGKCVATACDGARYGDWLIEFGGREALILRKCEDLLFIIGRALSYESLDPDWWPMSVWLDAEDALVLLCSSPAYGPNLGHYRFSRDNIEDCSDNVEEISAFVNNRVCREWGSSFATKPEGYNSDDESE